MAPRFYLLKDRPHPGPLPQERGTPWCTFGIFERNSTNPALGSRKGLKWSLLLLGEKAGMRAVVLTISFCLLFCGTAALHAETNTLPWLKVNEDGTGFVESDTGKKFIPWGFNYDRDYKKRLLEDYWAEDWQTVVQDFREMKGLGANVVRIHLQFGKFMTSADKPNRNALKKLQQLLRLAEETGLYLDLTGLGCYRKSDTPKWYGKLDESARWQAQANFWSAIDEECKDSPAVFCYDLINEPFVGQKRKEGDWLAGELGGFYYLQAITLDYGKRNPDEVAGEWAEKLKNAIRKQDSRHLITLGMLPISSRGFVKAVSPHLDFMCVHEYPKGGKIAESVERLKNFSVGKPLVIEETFPLSCNAQELGDFIKQSSPTACGWIGFYWGQTPEELARERGIAASITRNWLDLFQKINPHGKR